MKKVQYAIEQFAKEFELAIRIAMLIVSVAFGVLVIIVGATAANAASLRTDASITGDYIRLGDIFDNVKNADYVLGPAPQPGKDMILNARTLYRIASALDVDWQPATSAEQIILRREATVIAPSQISDVMTAKIKDSGVTDNFSLSFTNTVQDIVLPAGTEPGVDITAFQFDPQKDVFNAVIASPSADNPIRKLQVSGRIERLISVPVLKRAFRNGDEIGALDIDYIEMPASKIVTGTILDEKNIVNMTPRRVAADGKPLMMNDLESPKMVDRGDLITLVFADGPITLTVKGKSLQSGAMGDTVRVANIDSNKNLQGIVTGHREVTVR